MGVVRGGRGAAAAGHKLRPLREPPLPPQPGPCRTGRRWGGGVRDRAVGVARDARPAAGGGMQVREREGGGLR